MTSGRIRTALLAVLAVNAVLAVLLSPLGFERRPTSQLTPAGYVSIAAVLIGALLDVAALVAVARRARSAKALSVAAAVVLLVPNVTDRLGVFFRLPASPVISALEYVFLVTLTVTLALAWAAGGSGGAPRRDA